jgi:hypothetical protein
MPFHHSLAEALRAHIDAAGITQEPKGFLFRTSRDHKATALSERRIRRLNSERCGAVPGVFRNSQS